MCKWFFGFSHSSSPAFLSVEDKEMLQRRVLHFRITEALKQEQTCKHNGKPLYLLQLTQIFLLALLFLFFATCHVTRVPVPDTHQHYTQENEPRKDVFLWDFKFACISALYIVLEQQK